MTLETLDLRTVTARDHDAWRALWVAYLDFYDTTLADADIDAAFDQLLSDAPGTFDGLIAWSGDMALGLVHWVHHAHMWRPAGIHYLQDLFTTPEARGKGVARRLIEAVYARADATAAPQVYWLTQSDNHTARALYDRVARTTGFIRYDRVSA